jgi:hypothetical protein
MATESELRKHTEAFFELYWNPQNGKYPLWLTHWDFNSEIPNHDRRGCYALFREGDIVYVGIGIGNSFGIYIGHGLGDRLKRYWEVNKEKDALKRYKPKGEWIDKGITSILTIGFPNEHYYVAAALEIYLIEKLQPVYNFNYKTDSSKRILPEKDVETR